MSLPVILVAAVSRNGVIGAGGTLPWRLSSDLKRFKADTMGRPIVMGRKTWQSVGRALPGRMNIVVTRDTEFAADGVIVANSIAAALRIAERGASDLDRGDAICIIGGGEIYRKTIHLADRLLITLVEGEFEGDTMFPAILEDEWRLASDTAVPRGERDSHDMRYRVYERTRQHSP